MSNTQNADSDELEALFDSIVSAGADTGQPAPQAEPAAATGDEVQDEKVFSQIGHLTRKLHDTLRELGYDKMLEKAAQSMPDTKDRLSYIASMTEKAAERTLNATETAKPIQDKLGNDASALSQQWQRLLNNELDVAQFKNLVMQTRTFLDDVPNQAKATNAQLTEIMMAQDFQDLTGQVIKKVIELAQHMEGWMLQLLLETTPVEKRAGMDPSLLNGPVVNSNGRADVVTSQQQVDDLLESLGF